MLRPAFSTSSASRHIDPAAPTPSNKGRRLEHDRTLSQIARGLTWIGGAFLLASAAVIVWAVFRTVGVDDLLVALTVAGLGLGLPAIVAFVVAWILNSLGHPDVEADGDEATSEIALPMQRPALTNAAWGYAVAVLACIAAWGLRALLDPLLGAQITYAPLLLSVAFAAWYGGLGPATFATLLGVAISWYGYLSPRDRFGALDIDDAVQLGLYCAAALCIGGIASALRASRERAQTLTREVLAREAGLERTRTELAAERDRFQITLQSIADAVIATDAQGNVTFANDCAAALTGWPAAEAIGKPLARIFRTLDEQTRKTTAVTLEGGHADATAGMMLVARDGTERAVESKVNAIRSRNRSPGGFVLVFRDTTEARRARAAIEESEARFRVMADQTPVPLWMSDATRRYVYVNRAWLAFTGRTIDEEQGDGWTVGIHPEDFGPRQAAFADAFDAKKPFTLEYRLRRHDGVYRWILDHGAARFDGTGGFAGYIGACLDITERKEAAATLGIFEQRKTAFLASLAHELRNPLAPIRSSVELLQRMPSGDDPRVARAQEIIERNCARLARLVDDLLDLSRIDSGALQLRRDPVDVAPIVERAAARHAALIRDRGQQLVVDLPRERLRIEGDAERIEQMLAILIGNASQYTPREGRLGVAAQASGDAVEITVSDSGAGIEDDLRPLLFDLFDRASGGAPNAPQRLGTGLAIVARLARLSGGTVSAHSAGKDQGSRFVLRLPAPAHPPDAASADDDAARRSARLLIVDDNVDAADAIGTLLSLNGFDVATAHDPDAAMERATAFDPDVILLDIGLPGMTGFELARKLHAHPAVARAKLIAITGYGQAGDTEQARTAGFDGYLVKPVDLEQLCARIHAILAGERGNAAAPR
jgi:PAS domain S-box-containing protein